MRRAFTLIELLIVIAVIGVLAAILLPVLARARMSAQRATCSNNLRQIGSAITLYLEDWDERYPWAYSKTSVGKGAKPSLPDSLKAYLLDMRVWQCPSDCGETFYATKSFGGFQKRTPPLWQMHDGSSYAWMYRRTEVGGLGVLSAVRVSRVTDPSRTPVSYDLRPWHGSYRPDEDLFASPALYNVLYADQHIGRRTYGQIWGDLSDTVYAWSTN